MLTTDSAPETFLPVPRRGLTIQQAADYSGYTVWGIRSLLWERRIPFLKAGRRFIIDRADLDAFIENNKIPVRIPEPRLTRGGTGVRASRREAA